MSAEDIDDPLAQAVVERLTAEGWDVEHSPRNPARGEDPRWTDWYGQGCHEALARADAFVGVATPGWDGSSWMAHEAHTALDHGLEPFLWNPNSVSIPVGMRRFAQHPLEHSIGRMAEQLAAHRRSPPRLLDRHLRRLNRFLERLPGCPRWSSVLIAEGAAESGPFDAAVAPALYAARFDELVASRAWVNLHAVGVCRNALIVSVEPSPSSEHEAARCSVQISGPESRIAADSAWSLASDCDS